jgi:hypothetical protein
MNDLQKKYLDEVGHRLRRNGFAVLPKDAGLLLVEKAGVLLCHINMHSGMCYDADHVQKNGLEDALDQVRSIAVETQTYMRQMAAAPPLLAEGLSGDYRLLAEFNHIVLAGHAREGSYGVEFITWERIRDDTALWQGHYYDNDFVAAKQDFATRSGLLPASRFFTREQLAVIFDAAQNMTVHGLVSNPEQEKLLEQIVEQIEDAVPHVVDLANELTQYPKAHEPGEMQMC